ncbi:MAG: beta-lactamase family protein [Clostridiales bacterium]|nr:beta-lactamase family protein [Clostridiales bacterium]
MQKINIDKLNDNLAKRALQDIERGTISGVQIIVNQAGERVYQAEFGTNGVNGEPLPSNLTYRIASMTKPITTLAVLLEVEKGRLDLQSPITDYLQGYENLPIARLEDGVLKTVGKSKTPIRIFHLLSHTSGIEMGDIITAVTAPMTEAQKTTLKDVVDYFSDKPLFFETGTAQSYGPHVAFDVAARLVEIVSGMDYAAYVKENITDVIGMKDTTFTPNQEQWQRMVKKHMLDKNGKAMDAPDDYNHIYGNNPLTYYCGGAGLISTAEDYSLFAETLLNGGVAPNGKRVIGEEYLKHMYTPYCPPQLMDVPTQATGVTWGLGVRLFTNDNGKLPKGTFGWSGAYGTHFWVDPVNEITAVYMRNSDSNGGAGAETAENFETDILGSLQ